jgi:succinoglycan biosynthesis transport protein ExoP
MSSNLFFGLSQRAGGFEAEQRSRQVNRRRVIVFVSVFLTLAIIGLIYVYSRPAVYRAVAQLNFLPSTAQSGGETKEASTRLYSLRDEVQYLSSTTLLTQVWNDLQSDRSTPAGLATGDPAANLQTMLTVIQVPETNIVTVTAQGGEARFLPRFVDAVIADYQASLKDRYRSGSADVVASATEEAAKLQDAVRAKRVEVDAFRAKYNIVSVERDENQLLSEVKGAGTALNTANDKVIAAEARYGALKEAEASGQSVTRAKDNPTLASIEQAVSSIRSELKSIARQFTPEYMNIDPHVRELRARLADLEEQMVVQRKSSQQGALQEAREEVASARAAAAALRSQLTANQSSVQTFTTHFNEYKALQEQVTHLELLNQKAVDRVATLEAGDRARMPKVEVVQSPSVPQSPYSPQYLRDAALVVFAALVAGLVTMGIVEFFNQAPHQPSTVVVPQTWSGPSLGMTHDQPMALPSAQTHDALPGTQPASLRPASLPAPQVLPRELTHEELVALLNAADAEFRAVMAFILLGLTPAEVVNLQRGDVDRTDQALDVQGAHARSVALPLHVVPWIPSAAEPRDASLFGADGRPLTEPTLATALLYAAHDAGIEDADDVTPETLRHTYVAYLVRQGVRFADLAKIVGPLPADRLSSYKRLAPGSAPPSFDQIDRVLSVLKDRSA